MKMIVGLGNPGQKYVGTRHNVGFDVIAELGRRFDFGRPKSKFNGEIAETVIKNQKVTLISPLTFMNLSGQCVRAAVDFYKLETSDLLVICDDFNLDLGRIRLRPGGSAGGQNGLKDIIKRLSTEQFGRLRLGIGKPPPNWDVANYVLGKFSTEDKADVEAAVIRSADAVECWVDEGMAAAMNRFNANPNQANKNKNQKPKVERGESDDRPDGQDAD